MLEHSEGLTTGTSLLREQRGKPDGWALPYPPRPMPRHLMGAAHASAVYAMWGTRLNGSAFRLLVHMALTAKDSDNPPHYWAGRGGMAAALGKDDDQAGRQAVKRAVAQLVEAGAITNVRGARKNVGTAKWRVNLSPSADSQGDGMCTPDSSTGGNLRGTESDPLRGTESDPSGVHIPYLRGTETVPHRNTEEQQRSEQEEEISPTKVSPDRAREATAEEVSDLDPVRILNAAADDGIDVVALMKSAPEECTTRAQRRAWAAAQITKEAS